VRCATARALCQCVLLWFVPVRRFCLLVARRGKAERSRRTLLLLSHAARPRRVPPPLSTPRRSQGELAFYCGSEKYNNVHYLTSLADDVLLLLAKNSKAKRLYAPAEKVYERQTLCIVVSNGQVGPGSNRQPPECLLVRSLPPALPRCD